MGWVRCGLGTPSEVLSLPTPSEASGAIARFNTDLTENLLSAVAEFSASQAEGTPTPANPIPIVGVDKVDVVCCGKNLIDENARTDLTNNIQFYNANGLMLKARTYTWSTSESINWYVVDFATSTTLFTKYNSTFFTFTLNEDTRVKLNTYKVGIDHNDKFQLERGSEVTEYEPYNGTTALINLGGTYYGGSVDAVMGKIPVKKKLILFDGSSDEGWVKTSGNYFYIPVADALSTDDRTEIQSNIIVYATTSATVWGGYLRNGRIYVNTDGTPTDANAFKTWLASNNMQVVYPLETPEIEYASNTAEIPTIVGFNQVFADSGNIAVKYFETVGHKI